MRRMPVIGVIAILLVACLAGVSLAASATPGTSKWSQYLSIADVEKVTGLTGVKLVPRDPAKGAGGDLNFVRGDGDLAVMVVFSTVDNYDRAKKTDGFFASDVKDIGEAAFDGPSGPTGPYYVWFRKGTQAVSVNTYFDMKTMGDSFVLPMDKVYQLAKLIASRL